MVDLLLGRAPLGAMLRCIHECVEEYCGIDLQGKTRDSKQFFT